jgi:hypothetical protein
MSIIKGSNLMAFVGGKSIAHATSHKFTTTAKTSSTSDKDGGLWATNEVSGLSWEITADHLYVVEEYDGLFSKLIVGDSIDIIFGLPSDYDVNGLMTEDTGNAGGWTAPTTSMYQGKAVITSLAVTANAGDNATYSVTFAGTGAIKHVAV